MRQKSAKGTDQKYEAYRQAAMHLLGGLDSIGSEPCCAGEREGRWEGGESGRGEMGDGRGEMKEGR